MLRRRWADQRVIVEASARLGTAGAHPHRRWEPVQVSWSDLGTHQRLAMLAAEGRSLSSRTTDLSLVERWQADRFVQGLSDAFDEPDDEPASSRTAQGTKGAGAQLDRHAYWRDLQRQHQGLLVVHPRLLAAARWIESVAAPASPSAEPEKVLVFGEFNRPLDALTRCLNLRRYLREVDGNVPAHPPAVLHGALPEADPRFVAVLAAMREHGEAGPLTGLARRMRDSAREYDRLRDRLSRQVEHVVEGTVSSEGRMAPALRSWLLQVLVERAVEAQAQGRQFSLQEGRALARDLLNQVLAAHGETRPGQSEDTEDPAAQAGAAELLEALAQEAVARGRRSDFARFLHGGTAPRTRRILQALFNQVGVRPLVLVAQARVASEGLNLQRACRHIMFLHLNWNPAVIEQQIGRVDRVGSRWATQMAETGKQGEPPRIELRTVVLEGTSDEDRRRRILERQRMLSAHLFGEMLPPELTSTLPAEWQERLRQCRPDFGP